MYAQFLIERLNFFHYGYHRFFANEISESRSIELNSLTCEHLAYEGGADGVATTGCISLV